MMIPPPPEVVRMVLDEGEHQGLSGPEIVSYRYMDGIRYAGAGYDFTVKGVRNGAEETTSITTSGHDMIPVL